MHLGRAAADAPLHTELQTVTTRLDGRTAVRDVLGPAIADRAAHDVAVFLVPHDDPFTHDQTLRRIFPADSHAAVGEELLHLRPDLRGGVAEHHP